MASNISYEWRRQPQSWSAGELTVYCYANIEKSGTTREREHAERMLKRHSDSR